MFNKIIFIEQTRAVQSAYAFFNSLFYDYLNIASLLTSKLSANVL